MTRLSVNLMGEEVAIAEAALTLALRRKVVLEFPPQDRPPNCHDLIVGFLRAAGTTRTKREIKDYLVEHGYAETGAGPTVTQLVRAKRIKKVAWATYRIR